MSVKKVEIGKSAEGQRLDNYLMKVFKGVPKSRIYRIVRKGEVRVNGSRAQVSQKLQLGDVVRLPPVRMEEKKTYLVPDQVVDDLKARVRYEDESFLVIDKPSGLAVHKGSGQAFGVIEALRQASEKWSDLDLGHRLDLETSGCLVLCKTRLALTNFHEQIRTGRVDKRYMALVKGYLPNQMTRVDAPLSRKNLQGGERMVQVDYETGKPSSTVFRELERYAHTALLGCELLTGRTHQIRVHAAFNGFPLAGDKKYGDKAFNQHMKSEGLNRLFLHASMVQFDRLNGETLMIDAPLSPDLRQCLADIS